MPDNLMELPVMKLWLLTQSVARGYDTYDSCVVVADTEEQAKDMHPYKSKDIDLLSTMGYHSHDWAESAEQVSATYLGEAEDGTRRVVCASFNAG
jgi:hypothetical protein